MTRLIDAEVLKKTIESELTNDGYGIRRFTEIIDNAPKVEINTNDIEYKAYCKGLEDGKKIARPVDEEIETYKNAYRIMSDAFENEVRKNERPQGEWVKAGVGLYRCSLCDRAICTSISNDKPYEDFPFCHCGADMRGEENGNR